MAKKRKHRPSAKQLAARKKFAEMARARAKSRRKAAPAKAKRPSRRKRRSAVSLGKHRPVVIRKKSGYYRPKRSKLPRKMSLKNPFLGNLAIIGGSNPMAKRRRKSSRRRSRRSSRGLTLRNPIGSVLAAPRQMIRKDFLTEAASVAAGFVLPNVIMPRLPMSLRDSMPKAYIAKVAVVAGLAGAASLVNKRVSRAILLGGGVSILLDLWTDFAAPAILGGKGMSAFYGDPGDPGVGAFYGDPGDPGVGSSIGDAFGGDGGEGGSW